MESRWIYREVECELGNRLPVGAYPHTTLSKRLRFDVAEARDMLQLARSDYSGKAAWYSKRGDSSGADKVNEARRTMYTVLPYANRAVKRSGVSVGGEKASSVGEALMMKFMREREAKKKAGSNGESSEE